MTPAEWAALSPSERGACVETPNKRDDGGYGRCGVRRGGRLITRTHIAAWVEAHGLPPADKPFVLHHCDNPPCTNVQHLFVGTIADNSADCVNKGRHHMQAKTHCKSGHEFTPENTLLERDGRKRSCRACKRAAWHRWNTNKKAVA